MLSTVASTLLHRGRSFAEWGLAEPSCRQALPGPVQDVASILDPALCATPDSDALIGRHARYSYRELDSHANAAAAGLTARGLLAGDHVACSLDNHPDILIAFLAVMRLGCVWIGIPPKLAGPEKAYILENSDAQMFIADASTVAGLGGNERLPQLQVLELEPGQACGWSELLANHAGAGRPPVGINPWAPAAIAYTSGTTGFPKGVVHSQHSILQIAACRSQTDPRDFFSAGLRMGICQPLAILNIVVMSVMNTWLTGGVCICCERADAVGIAQWVETQGIEAMGTAAATVFDLLTRPEIDKSALDSLRHVVIGGGPCSEELRAKFVDRFGSPPIIGYGLTEAPGQVASSHPDEPTPTGSSGHAHPHVVLSVLDPSGNVMAPDIPGEICVAARNDGPLAGVYTPMMGYWKNGAATAKSLADGLLHTGDFGSIDVHGYVTLSARMNDVIIRGGGNIYPAEIERVLGAAGQIRAVAVVGRPDERLGETVEAFVQLMPGIPADQTTREALAEHCRANLAKYKVPVHWTFVDAMPRNAMDKIVKSKLREMSRRG